VSLPLPRDGSARQVAGLEAETPPWILSLVPAFTAVVFAAGLTFLLIALHQVLHRWGWAHSFDSAIYVRSVWGLANGSPLNPLVDHHAFGIHLSLLQAPMALLTPWVAPASLLLGAQALSFFATLLMFLLACQRLGRRAAGDDTPLLVGQVVAMCVLWVCSPWTWNPWLFDLRPEWIGVPLLTAGLFRAHRLGRWDAASIALACASVAGREEFAACAAAGLLLSPPWLHRDPAWKGRLAGALFCALWLAGYWYGVRAWLADGSFDRAHSVAAAFGEVDAPMTLATRLGYKAEIVLTFALSCSGMPLLGWRWAGAALPGFLLALVTQRHQALVLNFHYLAFAMPGLLVMAVDGISRSSRTTRTLRVVPYHVFLISCVLVALIMASVSSAFPGCGRWQAGNFGLLLHPGGTFTPEMRSRLRRVHDLMDDVPADVPLVAPWALLARHADRDVVLSWEQVAADPAGWDATMARVRWVAVPARAWRTAGAQLVLDGWHLQGAVPGAVALMTRDPGDLPRGLIDALAGAMPGACEASLGTWSDAGLTLCRLERLPDGRALAVVQGPAQPAGPPLLLALEPADDARAPGMRMDVLEGLVGPHQVASHPLQAVGSAPLRPGRWALRLHTAAGALPFVPASADAPYLEPLLVVPVQAAGAE
jgi:hypothetical protein